MRVFAKKYETGFSPIQLSITIETKEELKVFYSLFNHVKVCNWLRESGVDPDKIRSPLFTVAGEDDEFDQYTLLPSLGEAIDGGSV